MKADRGHEEQGLHEPVSQLSAELIRMVADQPATA
jgi:hypothetical protein